MFLDIKFLVNIDIGKMDLLGFPDIYDDEGLCNNYVFGDPSHAQFKDWKRFMPLNSKGLFDDNFDLRMLEKSIAYSVDPQTLKHY